MRQSSILSLKLLVVNAGQKNTKLKASKINKWYILNCVPL